MSKADDILSKYGIERTYNSAPKTGSASETESTVSLGRSRADKILKKYGITIGSSKADDISSWGERSSSLLDKVDDFYSTEWRKADEATSFQSSIQEEVYDLLSSAAKYRKQYGNDAQMTSYIDEVVNALAQTGVTANKMSKYWSNWDSQEAYDSYKYQSGMLSKYGDLSSAELLEAAKALEDGEEKDWINGYQYWKDREEKANLDTEAAQAEIDELNAQLKELRQGQGSSYLTGGNATESSPYAAKQSGQQTDVDEQNSQLWKTINEKQQYLTLAKRVQEQEALSGVADETSAYYDPDFEKTTGYRSTQNADAKWWENSYADAQYEWINNQNGFRNHYDKEMAALTQKSGGSYESPYAQKGYDKLTEDEIAIYNYYYAKDGKEKAQQYLDSIQEDLNYRMAGSTYSMLEGNTGLEMLFGVAAGLDQYESGFQSALKMVMGDDSYTPASAAQMASGMVREDLADNGRKLPEWMGGASLGQVAYDTITTGSNMMPSVLTSVVLGMVSPAAGSWVGGAMMGASAAGSAYQEAVNLGWTKNQARAYGVMVGASEIAMEKILGGITALGGGDGVGSLVFKKALSKVDNVLGRAALQLGANMLDEGIEEGLQEILEPWLESIITGKDFAVAGEDVLYASLLGALSASMMEGLNIATEQYGHYTAGQELKDSGITGEQLSKIGKTFSSDTVAYKLAGRVNADTGAYTIGRLFHEIGATLTEQNKAEITANLEQKGVAAGDAKVLVDAVAAVVDGAELTRKQESALNANDVLAAAIVEELIDKNSTYYQRNQGYHEALMSLAKEKANAEDSRAGQTLPGQENASTPDTVDGKNQTASEDTQEFSAEGKTILKNTGEIVNIRDVADIRDGKMILQLEDGSTVDASEVSYASQDEALVYETVAQMGASVKAANILVNGFKSADGMDAAAYAHGIEEAFRYGKLGIPMRELANSSFASKLNVGQQEYVYRQGKRMAGKQVAKEQATVSKKESVGDKKTPTAEKTSAVGKVHFDRKGRVFNEMQETALTTMEQMSAALGVEFYVYESYVNDAGKRVYKDADGNEVSAPNGWYDSKTGSIHIDLNAGQDGRGTMLFTVAHELTHFIKQWSPAKFKVLANFLGKQYGEKGVSVSELVKRQQDKAKRNGRSLSPEEAYEEMVADSMETMLTDGNVVQVMADLKQQDKGLWQKIKDWFRDLAEKLQRVVDAYKGVRPDTAEGRMVADMQDMIVTLESLYADALADASDNFQRAEKNTAESGGDFLYSLREFGDGTRFVDVQMDAKVFDGMTVAEMNKAAKTILMERFAGKVIGVDNRVFVNGDSVNEYLHPSKSIDMDTRKAKITAAGELDNLLDAGTALPNRPDGADGHIHPDAIDFSYFRTIFKVGNEYFEGIVNIKNNKRGKLLKDVTKIRNITQDIVSSYGDNPKSNFLRDVSMYSIRNGSGKVNKKFSDRDSDGRHLSEAQQVFFSDSKVRDADMKLKVMHHGSPATFTVFDRKKAKSSGYYGRGFYFTDSVSHAQQYGNSYDVYLNIINPLQDGSFSITKGQLRKFVEAVAENEDYGIENYGQSATVKSVVNSIYGKSDFAMIMDINATCVGDMVEAISLFNEVNGTDYDGIVTPTETVAFYPNQIKRVDNRNPSANPDIRYSDRDPAAGRVNEVLEKENGKLKEDVQYLKELLKIQRSVTNGTKFTKTSVEAMASQLMKSNNAKGDKKELAKLLNTVYEYIAKGEELTWEGAAEMAQPAVDWLRSHTVIKSELSQYARDILHDVRTSRVALDESQQAEAAYRYGSFNDFRKSMMGSITIAKDGVPLDIQWQEWANTYPDIFDVNMSASDMPGALADILSSLRNSDLSRAEYAYHADMIAQDLLQQVYDGYWRVSTLRTVADAKQRQINELKGKHHQKMNDLRKSHQEKVEQMKQEYRDDKERIRQEYREALEKKQKQTIERYQESRKRATENRQKTAMRQKIRGVIRDLDKLLNRGNKKRNVKEGMRDFVADALASAEVLFVDSYTNEDMVRNGVGTDLTPEETKLMNEARTIMDEIANLPTGYEGWMARQEQEYKLKGRLNYRMGKLKDVFVRERARLNKTQVSEVLGNLADSYAKLQNSEYAHVQGAYHEAVHEYLKMLQEDIGGTVIKDMTIGQLEELYKAYTMVKTTVHNANRMFADNLNTTRDALANRVMFEVREAGGEHGLWSKAGDKLNSFSWNNEKPVYAFERIGSKTLKALYGNIRKGQDNWAVDLQEANDFRRAIYDKYNRSTWDMDKQYKFTSSSGVEFELNLDQIMSLYAYSKRAQAHDHLLKGGFVFDGNTEVIVNKKGLKMTYLNKNATAYNLSFEILEQIISKLTSEQKAFVDEMQEYLSTTMGEKGNEVSMELYGVKLFNEKFYFPLRSAGQYMERAKEADLKKEQGQINIANSGFSKAVKIHASNPVVLSGFMDVWAGHVNEMSMYHSFVLPMEDFRRVYNYSSPHVEGQQSASVNGVIQNAYGAAATDYIDRLYRDLNGGAITDNTTGLINKLMNLFKKGAVFASASVVVQQPSAIARAAALVDVKHFFGPRVDAKRHKALWAEVKRYAPVAIIKEMGFFDTNMGRSATDFLTGEEYKGIKEKAIALVKDEGYRDELLSKTPALADELTWCAIWEAVKRETRERHPGMDVKSEEFLKLAGERFSEVIDKTQVYDSVLARSANMRSKDTGMKMATAFMAEPTTSINMVADALRKGKEGNKKYARRAIGSVVASVILNSFLVSFVYAARDDDEDESYTEKYLGAFVSGIVDGVNPATYIPFLKDIVSIVQGYDVERSDMAVISDLWNAWQKLGRDDVSAWMKVEGFVGSICQIFGLPVKNIMRDVRSLYQAYDTAVNGEDTTMAGIKYAVQGAITGKTVSDPDQLYEARIVGDEEHAARVEARYDDEDSANAAVRQAIKDRFLSGEIDTQTALRQMVLYAGMDASEAHWMMDAWEYRKAVGTDEGYSMYNQFFESVQTGENLKATIKEYTDNGAKDTTLVSMITKHFKPEYLEMSDSERAGIRGNLINAYEQCGLTREEAEERLSDWDFEAKYGFDYSDRRTAYMEGTVSAAQLRAILVTVGGYTEEDAAYQIKAYDWELLGYEDVTLAAIRAYEQYCEAVDVPKNVFLHIRDFSNNTENDVDEEGKTIYYSAMKKVMAEIDAQNLTAEQKTAIAKSLGWSEKSINKYKPW